MRNQSHALLFAEGARDELNPDKLRGRKMADPKKESARQARHVEGAAETMVNEGAPVAAHDIKGSTTRHEEAVDEAVHRVQRHAEDQAEDLKRTAHAVAAASERVVAGTAEALASSGTEFTKALQDASRVWAELTQDTMKRAMQATEALLRCRNFGDAMQTQSDYLRSNLDAFIEKGTQLSDISNRLVAMATLPLAATMGLKAFGEDSGEDPSHGGRGRGEGRRPTRR
jgi:hypothetical protein